MKTLVLWGDDGHKVRAEMLATTYPGTAKSIKTTPKWVWGLKTLMFWGHGEVNKFCDLTPVEFVALVTAWKKANSGLETVEILTCNARHGNLAYPDSYTEKVVKNLTAKQDGIRFKALPGLTTKNGVACAFSILKWKEDSATWAYIGGSEYTQGSSSQHDKNMSDAAFLLEDFMPPRGGHVGYARAFQALKQFRALTVNDAYATKRNWNQTKVDEYNARVTITRENSFIMAGTLSSLHWWTRDIR